MEALKVSLLPIKEELEISKRINEDGPFTVASDTFLKVMDPTVPWHKIFGGLQRLTLGLSAPHRPDILEFEDQRLRTGDVDDIGQNILEQRSHSHPSLHRFFQLSNDWRNPESLDLRWYNTGSRTIQPQPEVAVFCENEDDKAISSMPPRAFKKILASRILHDRV